jgi:hypothetical protein
LLLAPASVNRIGLEFDTAAGAAIFSVRVSARALHVRPMIVGATMAPSAAHRVMPFVMFKILPMLSFRRQVFHLSCTVGFLR